ncbi:DEAD/DEAH box helicase [Dichotomicrobium thermohalophilum]|uniref:DEAD-box ATP-dependent RNA helicase RhpA n=1 Tax=Dichotomicrobium thermohalophilum TaxID=933063 RepID=A0A397PCE0_9HYPH|nr:superfamily II DNA/RNA helicase [Dichotomicrobium thermohalophilum]
MEQATQGPPSVQNMKFTDLGLSDKVLAAVQQAGYQEPTPIQAKAIPIAVEGRDVVGIAQTGTGKTASFVLPMLTRLERGRARARMPRSLILEPTRELAAQVAQSFEELGGKHKLTVALLIGGVSFEEQYRKLDRGADVLIATPGRLLDHFERGKLLLTAVDVFVIDEADRMLDMGFIPDIERICGLLSPARQTLFFSATMPPEIEKLTHKFLNAPERVSVDRQATAAPTIEQRLKATDPEAKAKRAALRDLIREQDVKNAIIFCNRKRDVGIVYRSLKKHGFNAGELHGDMDQRTRMQTLESFRNGDIKLLVASDVAARGLDIPEVSHVFNYDVPTHAEDYIHRIGRTGRAGREGFAAMLVTQKEIPAVKDIEKLLGGEIEWMGEKPEADSEAEEGKRRKRGGRKRGGRKSAGAEDKPQAEDKPTAEEKPKAAENAKAEDRGESRGKAKTEGEADQAGSGRRRGRRGGRRRQQQEQAEPALATPEYGAPAPSNGEEKAEPSRRKASRKRELVEADASESTAFGMSDQVPAFLMRPIRRPSSSR